MNALNIFKNMFCLPIVFQDPVYLGKQYVGASGLPGQDYIRIHTLFPVFTPEKLKTPSSL